MPPRHTRLSTLKNAARWILRPKTLILDSEFTRRLIRRYCAGKGLEIGPGLNPQSPPGSTVFVDKFRCYAQTGRIDIHVQSEAEALPFAASTFDFLVSSHVLEHCPDTLSTLEEWLRVLRPGGRLVLRLPHARRSFDSERPTTSLAHHLEDRALGSARSDEAHLDEFLAYAIDRFPHHWKEEARLPDGTFDRDFLIREGHVHYHVWTQTEMLDMLRHLKLAILFVMDETLDRADSFVIVAERPADGIRPTA